ncbi:hypothetical protein BDR03DRAFT_964677 [Suillus americanus]|nr:hypothetical protein BDR03DRAFT_964677 [Suillus americanus]
MSVRRGAMSVGLRSNLAVHIEPSGAMTAFILLVLLKARLHRMGSPRESSPSSRQAGRENYECRIGRQRRQLSIWAIESLP